jgi:hypothetical protein
MTDPKKAAPATDVDVDGIIAEAAKTGNLSDSKFNAFLSIMMAKEARLAEKEANLEIQMNALDVERKKESERFVMDKIINQKKCRHLKGGLSRQRGQQTDPSVAAHTFIDGDMYIKCLSCGAKWKPKDTKEFFVRKGVKIPNWTNIGWVEALELAQQSSNRPSSSERSFGDKSSVQTPQTPEGMDIPNLQI